MFRPHVVLLVERHRLRSVNLAHLAGPADAAAPIVVRHVGRRHELLKQPADGIGVGAHPPLLHHHVPLFVELARNRIGQPPALEPRPQLQPVLRHRPEILRLVQSRLCIQSRPRRCVCATSVNWFGMTYLCASFCASTNALCSSASFLRVAPHRLQILGFIRIVRRFHLGQRHLFCGVVRGSDLAGPLEGKMLKHVCQAALARGIVHVARIDKRGVAEDRRIRTLADQQRQPVRQHLRCDPLLEAL